MENNSKKLYENINTLYDKSGYLQRYGTDILIVIIILVIVFLGVSYFSFLNQIKPIKANWLQERCNPKYMPFAGLINKKDDQTVLQATAQNFEECSQTTLQNISSYAMAPIYYTVHLITQTFNEVSSGVNSARGMFHNVRNSVTSVGDDVYNRSLNVMTPIQEYFIAIKSALGKVTGVATASIYTLYGSYLALKSLLGAIIEVVIIIMVALAALIVILWILPFTWPVAASMTSVFLAVLIPLIILTVTMQNVFKSSINLPKQPGSCFDGDTIIEFEDKTKIPISKLDKTHIGKEIKGGHKIISIFKFKTDNNKIYKINDILVSGSHRILYNGKYIRVNNHPNKIEISDYNKDFIFCLNTNTGKIPIFNSIFLDYDDLLEEDLLKLKQNSLWLNFNNENFIKQNIYKHFSCGFEAFTLVEMFDGTSKFISECQIGDLLKDNIKVLGTVLLESDLPEIFLYNDLILAGGNIIKLDADNNNENLQRFSRIKGKKFNGNISYLFNLITDKQVIPINNEIFGDFNSGLDVPLNFYLN